MDCNSASNCTSEGHIAPSNFELGREGKVEVDWGLEVDMVGVRGSARQQRVPMSSNLSPGNDSVPVEEVRYGKKQRQAISMARGAASLSSERAEGKGAPQLAR